MNQQDDPRSKILARRAAFVAAALAGMCASCTDAKSCLEPASDAAVEGGDAQEDVDSPEVCLEPPLYDATPDGDATPQPCLEPPLPEAGPEVCLSPGEETGPEVCLSPGFDDDEPDSGWEEPQPCLSPPAPDGGY